MDEQLLWSEFRDGEKQALEKLYRLYAADMVRYGRKFSDNEQVVEDAIQDLFIDLWRRREHLGEAPSVRNYLFASLRRRVIRVLSAEKKRAEKNQESLAVFLAEFTVQDRIVAGELDAERRSRLKKALERLSDRQKEVIYLRFFQDMDYKDIGEVMQLNYQSVRNLVSSAIRSLRSAFLLLFLLFCMS